MRSKRSALGGKKIVGVRGREASSKDTKSHAKRSFYFFFDVGLELGDVVVNRRDDKLGDEQLSAAALS